MRLFSDSIHIYSVSYKVLTLSEISNFKLTFDPKNLISSCLRMFLQNLKTLKSLLRYHVHENETDGLEAQDIHHWPVLFKNSFVGSFLICN